MDFFKKLNSLISGESSEAVQQAKEFFQSMGCSHFHMARENPGRYNKYKQLGISKQTEVKWTEEKFDEYYTWFIDNPTADSMWKIYSVYMYELFLALRTDTALAKMPETTQLLRDRIPLKDRIIIAETINTSRFQRKDRLGLIYLAYDLKNVPAAKAFVELSLHFSSYDDPELQDIERCQKAAKLCNEIKLELGL